MNGKLVFNVDPCPKPRMTQRDKWAKRPCVMRYFGFVNAINIEATRLGYKITVPLSVTFIIPMPKSWSARKKKDMEGKPHKQTPDLDNLLKAFKDALLKQDSAVWQYGKIEKRWGYIGSIEVYK